MLRDTLALGHQACRDVGAELVMAYTPAGAFDAGQSSLHHLWRGRRLLQRGHDLGERMAHALTSLHRRGAHSVLLIGSDAPDLPPELLVRAFTLLDADQHSRSAANVVFGPGEDGGFYLIGARGLLPRGVFEDVAWSTQSTLEQVLANASRLKLVADASSLPPWRDIDSAGDLLSLQMRLNGATRPTAIALAPHTRRWLRDQSTLMRQLFDGKV